MFHSRLFVVLGLLAFCFIGLTACGESDRNEGSNACSASGCGSACGGDAIDESKIGEPDGWKANAGDMDDAALLEKGKELWADKALSGDKNMACATCHSSATAGYGKGFAAPYPHKVTMAAGRGVARELTAAEMVQFCLVVPMKAESLKWDDVNLAALTRAVEEAQKEYKTANE
ncbi:MAG: cytochrome c peroxidase [Planctomycetota bacterium]|jgi:cytochrome c peroxidase